MDQRLHNTTTVVICHPCEGSGFYYTEVLTDYHRGEYDTTQHVCHKCEGSGRLTETVKVTYEAYKQPKRWVEE